MQISFFLLKNVKILCHGYVKNDHNEEEIVGKFKEKKLKKKKNQTDFRMEKAMKEKVDEVKSF